MRLRDRFLGWCHLIWNLFNQDGYGHRHAQFFDSKGDVLLSGCTCGKVFYRGVWK